MYTTQLSGSDSAAYVFASLYFLTRDDLFLKEKPYAFRFPVEDQSFRQTNMKMESKELIRIIDIRGSENRFSFEENGFEVLPHATKLAYEDFYNPERVPIYLRELETLLKDHLRASYVEVFRYGVSASRPVLFCCFMGLMTQISSCGRETLHFQFLLVKNTNTISQLL